MQGKQSYGCLMLGIHPKMSKNIVNFSKKIIPDKNLYIGDCDETYGREEEPHITVKYGFTEDLTDNQVKSIMEDMNDIIWSNPGEGNGSGRIANDDEARVNTNSVIYENKKKELLLGVTGLSMFQCENYDVVKLNVEKSPILMKINQLCNKFPHIDTFPDYIPHITLAYIKKGTFDKKSVGHNIKIPITGFHYSTIDNNKRYYQI